MNIEALPAHLAERTRADAPARSTGEFVLYWMHHAARADENPAFDVARIAATALGLPLLVYQGLGGRHPFDSDRHHTFIMEGARDVNDALRACGVRHVFSLTKDPARPTPLTELGMRAALVVTEDFPVPPFPQWSARLAARSGTPVWHVDTACVVPMRVSERGFARAFELRKALQGEFAARVGAPWPACTASPPAFDGDVGFEPVDWSTERIADLCAQCEIDHGVLPAPETRGGSSAGYARWDTFRARGLARYARLRNDAAVEPPAGVSRLSPYLHHGHVAPTRIAREASEDGSSGAEKFLDELLIWRELAHNFCFHRVAKGADPGAWNSLPEWARETLDAHAGDPRDSHLSWESLARAQTGDPLWDAAQVSLLIHGELHNNLRMTWGKAPLNWTASPREALDVVLDLNHRYALDGSDPNSFGGVLYALGLFDRPFKPPQPVFGTVRGRSTAAHAERLDMRAFRRRMNRRATSARIAVVGAGIAGLAAARTLADAGLEVTVFERGNRPGGRASSRRPGEMRAGYDHGAQYFTARDPRFVRYVQSWARDGLVAPWTGRWVSLDATGSTMPHHGNEPRWVGTPDIGTVAAHLASGAKLRTGVVVDAMHRDSGRWRLAHSGQDATSEFDAVVLAMPPEQALRLLDATRAAGLTEAASAVRSVPCWCAMVTLAQPASLPFDAARIDDDVLAWAARNSAKPGRDGALEAWTLHATPAWSAERLDTPPDDAAREMFDAFQRVTGASHGEPLHLAGHRWGLARVEHGAGEPCLHASGQRLTLCGDWCVSSRVEDAFLSGVAASARAASEIA